MAARATTVVAILGFVLVPASVVVPVPGSGFSVSTHFVGLDSTGTVRLGASTTPAVAIARAASSNRPDSVPSPFPLTGAAMAYDIADGYDVLFGGASKTSISSSTWIFTNGGWSNITATAGTPPSPREGMSMTYDTSDGYILAYGGYNPTEICSGSFDSNCYDTWEFHSGHWTQLFPTFDPVCYPSGTTTICNQFPGGSNPITYDTATGDVVLFSGYTYQSEYWAATWTYHADNWTQLNLTQDESPPPMTSEEIAFDSGVDAVVLFGGSVANYNGAWDYDATWFFKGGTWTNESSAYPLAPSPRMSFGFTYDSTDSELVLFGGSWSICHALTPNDCETSAVRGTGNDTWTFGVTGWNNVTATSAPVPRVQAAIADYPGARGVLLFGGITNSSYGGQYLGDTWSWAGSNHTWTPINAPLPLVAPVITANPDPAVFAKPVQFDSVESGGFLPYTYSWSFGDGGMGGNLASITHAYATNGPFLVVLTVTDASGERTQGSLNISILLQAEINASVTSGAPPLKVNFTATAVGGASPYNFSWNFGDGSSMSAQGATAHTFNRSGTFTVILTVTDGQGHQSSAQVQICAGKCGNTGFLGLPGDYGYFVVGGAMAALVAVFAILGIARRQGRDDGQAGSRSRVDQSPPVDDGPIEILQPGEVDPAEDLV
jgi:PKD repeat protein